MTMTAEREAKIRWWVETGARMGDSMPELREALAALDEARASLAAAEARLEVYRPIVEQAVAWHDWSNGDGLEAERDQESEALHALIEAMPDEIYYEIVDDGPEPATSGTADAATAEKGTTA
jgi:hypothetical protein